MKSVVFRFFSTFFEIFFREKIVVLRKIAISDGCKHIQKYYIFIMHDSLDPVSELVEETKRSLADSKKAEYDKLIKRIVERYLLG